MHETAGDGCARGAVREVREPGLRHEGMLQPAQQGLGDDGEMYERLWLAKGVYKGQRRLSWRVR